MTEMWHEMPKRSKQIEIKPQLGGKEMQRAQNGRKKALL